MKLYEYEAEIIAKKAGLMIPNSILIETLDQAIQAYKRLNTTVFVKAQILTSGRGKAGGIIRASNEEEVKKAYSNLFGTKIKGILVKKILIQERIQSSKEIYLGLTIDRSTKSFVVLASIEGGVDIEKLASEKPEMLVKEHIDPLSGLNKDQIDHIAFKIGLTQKNEKEQFRLILQTMYTIFLKNDCQLLESNPLAITNNGKLIPLDFRMIIDDNALFRHPEFQLRTEELTELEIESSKKGLTFVQLNGDIGIIGNGAGLVMSTLDMVEHFGGKPANFCDVGGGAEAKKVADAVNLVLKQKNIRVLLLNILGGITQCTEVAQGLVDALKAANNTVPVVVRLSGTNEKEGRNILRKGNYRYTMSTEEAVKESLKLLNR